MNSLQSLVMKSLAPPFSSLRADFMAGFWQWRPLLVRGAFPSLAAGPLLEADELAGLACDEDASARLVVGARSVAHGPFDAEDFAALEDCDDGLFDDAGVDGDGSAHLENGRGNGGSSASGSSGSSGSGDRASGATSGGGGGVGGGDFWSLLVNDVERAHPPAHALVEAFSFIPTWRHDDVMVSYAGERGGGIGAHVDSYDVFLVQGLGRREWSIMGDTRLSPAEEAAMLVGAKKRGSGSTRKGRRGGRSSGGGGGSVEWEDEHREGLMADLDDDIEPLDADTVGESITKVEATTSSMLRLSKHIMSVAKKCIEERSFMMPKEELEKQMNELRLLMGERLELRDPWVFKPIWVVDFPLLEKDEETNSYHAMHHPFTSPKSEDLKMLSLGLGLSIDDIIQIHTAPIYFVSMIGFKPNFPYLWGLDTRLNIARRSSPRSSVPKGSVAIAAGQCGIYPESSPGGWHLLGNTSIESIQGIEPGDQIKFKRVSHDY